MRLAPTFVSLVATASAMILPRQNNPNCETGQQQCCSSVETANDLSAPVLALLQLLGINPDNLTGQIGLSCIPMAVVGGINNCNTQAVCCSGNNFNGLVVIGCTPIIIDPLI